MHAPGRPGVLDYGRQEVRTDENAGRRRRPPRCRRQWADGIGRRNIATAAAAAAGGPTKEKGGRYSLDHLAGAVPPALLGTGARIYLMAMTGVIPDNHWRFLRRRWPIVTITAAAAATAFAHDRVRPIVRAPQFRIITREARWRQSAGAPFAQRRRRDSSGTMVGRKSSGVPCSSGGDGAKMAYHQIRRRQETTRTSPLSPFVVTRVRSTDTERSPTVSGRRERGKEEGGRHAQRHADSPAENTALSHFCIRPIGQVRKTDD